MDDGSTTTRLLLLWIRAHGAHGAHALIRRDSITHDPSSPPFPRPSARHRQRAPRGLLAPAVVREATAGGQAGRDDPGVNPVGASISALCMVRQAQQQA